jgi:dTDP-glucose 4,6-dehydratase
VSAAVRHVVTGSSGFVGRFLVSALLGQGKAVVNYDLVDDAMDRPQAAAGDRTFVAGDIRRAKDLDQLGLGPKDVVYHLAARQFTSAVPLAGRDRWFAEVNVEGTRALLEAMRRGGAHRLVFVSTDMTYGLPRHLPVAPDHPQRPLGPYGASKVAAEALIRAAPDLSATIFRPRLITGAGRLGILSRLFELIRLGLPVPMIGRGDNRYQMISVQDCVLAMQLAVDKGCPQGPFNLGSQSPPTTAELLRALIAHAKSRSVLMPVPSGLLKPVLHALDRAGLTLLYPEQFNIAGADILLDTTTTRDVLGWVPSVGDIVAMKQAYDVFLKTRKN